MGQRHQIYIRVPKVYYNENNPNNRDAVTLGFHHSWLYGATAVEMLDWFLRVYDKNKQEKYSFAQPNPNLESFKDMSTNVLLLLNGWKQEKVHFLNEYKNPKGPNPQFSGTKSITTPENGDNNDGITIIDLENVETPKVAFGSIGHTEGKYSLSPGLYSPLTYLQSYYPDTDRAAGYKAQLEEMQPRGGSNMVEVMERLSKVPMVTEEDARRIFPDWSITLNAARVAQRGF